MSQLPEQNSALQSYVKTTQTVMYYQCFYLIKYIKNNLVFNHYGGSLPTMSLPAYNYKFLGLDEKYQVHDNFCQLIIQNSNGKIYALQRAA